MWSFLSDVDSIDVELSKKLGEELKLETNVEDGGEIPATIKDYLAQGPFKVQKPIKISG